MGRKQGGQGKGKPKMKDKDFGKTIIKRHAQGFDGDNKGKSEKMMSILDNNALDDFINQAEMDGDGFEVHRVHKNHAFLVEASKDRNVQQMTGESFDYEHLEIPRKPSWTKAMTAQDVDERERRAFMAWRRKIATLESVSNYERKVTPFEKNLEVWRQLWRVCERSDMVIQVVDGRNPLLYYTNDLRKYAAEHRPPRPMMLLINKADFLTEYQRMAWVEYLERQGIKFVFYSAATEQGRLDKKFAAQTQIERAATINGSVIGAAEEAKEAAAALAEINKKVEVDEEEMLLLVRDLVDTWQEELGTEPNERQQIAKNPVQSAPMRAVAVDADCGADDEEVVWGDAGDAISAKVFVTTEKAGASAAAGPDNAKLSADTLQRRAKVLNREELLEFLRRLPLALGLVKQDKNKGKYCVGMLGYPNVGKSSVINSLLGVSKAAHGVTRVAVSSTPGKTKHFQTINLSQETTLCDCPGLVFPSFMRSTGEMICAGILPIHQMRDYIEPASVIASRVPLYLLDASYGMHINREIDVMDDALRPPTAHEMLSAYCAVKGYITSSTGRWDEFRACKEILSDFADGVILYVSAPPTHANNQESGETDMQQKWLNETAKTMMRRERVAERVAVQKLSEAASNMQLGGAGGKVGAGPAGKSDGTVVGGKLPKQPVPAPAADADCDDEGGELVFGFTPGRQGKSVTQYAENGARVSAADDVPAAKAAPRIVDGYEVVDDSSSDEEGNSDEEYAESLITGASSVRIGAGSLKPVREHKKHKHWGKKNKKLRDKNPYEEKIVGDTSIPMVAYTTSRQQYINQQMAEGAVGQGVGVKGQGKWRRHDPYAHHGTQYTRTYQPVAGGSVKQVAKGDQSGARRDQTLLTQQSPSAGEA